MTIRPTTAGDLDAVMRLAAEVPEAPRWGQAAYQAFFAADTGETRRLFLAESSGHLAGFIAGQIVAGVCELESIAVAPAHRRSGIGRALLAALTKWATGHGASKVQLEVRAGNTSAKALYEKAGFHRDGLRPGYYHDPEDDALLMTLPLAP